MFALRLAAGYAHILHLPPGLSDCGGLSALFAASMMSHAHSSVCRTRPSQNGSVACLAKERAASVSNICASAVCKAPIPHGPAHFAVMIAVLAQTVNPPVLEFPCADHHEKMLMHRRLRWEWIIGRNAPPNLIIACTRYERCLRCHRRTPFRLDGGNTLPRTLCGPVAILAMPQNYLRYSRVSLICLRWNVSLVAILEWRHVLRPHRAGM